MTPNSRTNSGGIGRLAEFCVRRRRLVVLAWLGVMVLMVAVAPRFAGDFSTTFATPGSESAAASDIITSRFGDRSADAIDVVWEARRGVRDPAVRETIDRLLERAGRLEGIGAVGATRVAQDGSIAAVRLELDREAAEVPAATARSLIDRAAAASRGNDLRIELGGFPIQQVQGGGSPEAVALLLAALILLVAFGSIVAAALPLAIAVAALAISVPQIGLLAAVIDVPEFAPAVAGLIGVGVGIDYALLILARYRSGLHAGACTGDATIEAMTTAGRSVLLAGSTVVVSLLGLLVIGVPFLRGVALATSLAVLIVMAASVTLLPALLSMLGRRVEPLRLPRPRNRAPRRRRSPAERWSETMQKRPWTAAVVGAAVLLALAAPVLDLRFGFPDAGNDQAQSTTRQAYDLLEEGFGPGANGPLLLVSTLTTERDAVDLDAFAARLRRQPGIAAVSETRLSEAQDAAIATVVPTTSLQDAATSDLVNRLRVDLRGMAVSGDRPRVLVGGVTAALVDQSDLVGVRLPWLFAVVLGLSFVLLTVALRAPVLAVKAAAMNMLSVGAAYGVVSLVAQGGFVGQLVGIDTELPVPPFLPVMIFAILFGLSMDYEVFLLSRVREEFLCHGDTTRAVSAGLAKTARVITAAAAIMVAVFLSFLVADDVNQKLIGVGLATAIFVDATLVRMVLVPAVIQLLGGTNWWIPRWLDRALPGTSTTEMQPAPRASAPS